MNAAPASAILIRGMRALLCVISVYLFCCGPTVRGAGAFAVVGVTNFVGMCDASAGVAVSSNRLVVANDEDNTLRVYDSQVGGPALAELNLDWFLQVGKKSPEADIEGAARLGKRIYWIGSHGRNREGQRRESRCVFFATELLADGGKPVLVPAGVPCRDLLKVLMGDRRYSALGLAEAAQRTPKETGALDIEGLAAAPEAGLLIGFRNPIPGGKALLVPLLNPGEAVQGSRARLGEAILLDLEGRGIRDITWCGDQYLIIAGAHDAGSNFRLFKWKGAGDPAIALAVEGLEGYNPEALLLYGDGVGDGARGARLLQVLSDDGGREIDGTACKDLKDPMRRCFRGFWLVEEGRGAKDEG